jgi:hypothetical protein
MKRPRFRIASILVLVFYAALAIGALRAADDYWQSGLFGGTLLVLLVAVLLAIHRTSDKRAFWLGFAIFGWTYLGASLVPPVESRLPTTRCLAYLDSKVPGRMTVWDDQISSNIRVIDATPSNNLQSFSVRPVGRTILTDLTDRLVLRGPSSGTMANFLQIGHCIIALLMAFLGGQLSRFLQGRRHAEAAAINAG